VKLHQLAIDHVLRELTKWTMTLVAGIDSSTQSCKVVIRDAETGKLVRQGRASHPDGTEVHPDAWWSALQQAIDEAGGLDDVAAASVAGQQHGMVVLDENGEVVRPALLWNDTRSAGAAADLIDDLGGGDKGRQAWVDAVGIVPVASFTLTKLRWLARNEPENAARVAAVCLPHDWLTWKLSGARAWSRCAPTAATPAALSTGPPRPTNTATTCWSSASAGACRCPRCSAPPGIAGHLPNGAPLGPGRRRQRRRRSRRGGAARRRGHLHRHRPARCSSPPTSHRTTPAGPSPASPTPPAGSCRSWSR
jgi:xylulokinase